MYTHKGTHPASAWRMCARGGGGLRPLSEPAAAEVRHRTRYNTRRSGEKRTKKRQNAPNACNQGRGYPRERKCHHRVLRLLFGPTCAQIPQRKAPKVLTDARLFPRPLHSPSPHPSLPIFWGSKRKHLPPISGPLYSKYFYPTHPHLPLLVE